MGDMVVPDGNQLQRFFRQINTAVVVSSGSGRGMPETGIVGQERRQNKPLAGHGVDKRREAGSQEEMSSRLDTTVDPPVESVVVEG